MKILFYTDCMSIDIQVKEELRYPTLIQNAFSEAEISIIDLDGMTTFEAAENVDKALNEKPDIVIYAFGVNDALPRGLSRSQRGAIIRWTYKVKMTKQMRLWFRTFFLNPLEYIMQIATKPKHYYTIEETLSNIDKCSEAFKQNTIRTVLINIAPVLNYRFIKSNKHIEIYNTVINDYCVKQGIYFVDAFNIFKEIGFKNSLAKDKFHYNEVSHKGVAEELIKIIQTIKE